MPAVRRPTSRGPGRAKAALFVLAVLAGCASSGPDAAVRTPFGTARADEPRAARELALMLVDLGPRVRALLPDTRDRPTEVWLDDFRDEERLAERPGVVGFTALDQGHIRIRSDRLGIDADFVLVHELVHALLGPTWDPLPAVLKEGLCDALAARLVPEAGARVRAARLLAAGQGWAGARLELAVFEPGLRTRRTEELPFGAGDAPSPLDVLVLGGAGVHLHQALQQQDALYGYGMLVVERIVDRVGFAGLHALCLQARRHGEDVVPLAWILAAAELDTQPARWRAAMSAHHGEADLLALSEHLAVPLANWIAGAFRHRFPGRDAAAFLEQAVPTLGWRGARIKLALGTSAPFREALGRAWTATHASVLRPGEGFWIQDGEGVTLTDLLAPTEDEPSYTISRLRVDAAPSASEPRLPTHIDPEALVAWVQLAIRDDGRVDVRALHPLGFVAVRVEVHGRVVADLARGLGVEEHESDGWTVVSAVVEGLSPGVPELFAPDADVVISLRSREPDAPEQSFPLRLSRRR